MAFSFVVPEQIIYGKGALEEVGEQSCRLGKKALVVSGKRALAQSGTLERIVRLLTASGVEAEHFPGVDPEPDVASVDAGRKVCAQKNCDMVVAAGGGSAIDVGKAIAALANESAPTSAFLEGARVRADGLPCVAIPTTSGTGAEVTRNSVICDKAAQVKKSIRSPGILPRVAIVDPELTVSLPAHLTAYSGMDALTQAIESLVSIHASPLTKALSLQAVRLLKEAVPAAVENGKDMEARTNAAYGSLLAGMALGNARLGAVHGVAHPLGVRYDIPHGLICAVLLPHVMEMNAPFAQADFAELEAIFEEEPVAFVRKLLERLRLPVTFREFGLKEEGLDAIARESMPSGSLKANPKKVEAEDMAAILRKVN